MIACNGISRWYVCIVQNDGNDSQQMPISGITNNNLNTTKWQYDDESLVDILWEYDDTHFSTMGGIGKSITFKKQQTYNNIYEYSNWIQQGLVNVLIEYHPNIGNIISNRYLKVMFKIPKSWHIYQTLFNDMINSPAMGISWRICPPVGDFYMVKRQCVIQAILGFFVTRRRSSLNILHNTCKNIPW